MMPRGPPTQLNGGAQQVPPSLLRSNSGLLSGQAGEIPSQNMFPSLVSPRNQFNNSNMSLLGNMFGNGGPSPGLPGPGPAQPRFIDGGPADSDMGFKNPPLPSSYNPPQSQMLTDQQQQFQGMPRPNAGPVKLEQQANGELQGIRNPGGPVKLEPQQLQQGMRNLGPIKMEPQDSSLFLQQQQQQQLLLSRQNSQAAAAAHLLQQQRLMQMQQQQQLLKAMPPQQQRPLPQNLPMRSPSKPVYEPGMCARRLTHYMYQQQHRPEDNNIEFWRKFVAEYFAPNAKKKWCISMYGTGRQNTGVLPQDVWHCEICNRKPGRGFEATAEVLPRLFKIKYESGTLEELLYVDMPREYQNSSGQIVLDYAKAIQESVFEELRVVRDGQLRIVFSPDLKICSWEFCARRHEELIPRRLLIPQVSQLGAAAQKCQTAAQNSSSNSSSNTNSVSELQNNCNMFLASARQLAKALEVPLVNDLGYTKRFVRCLQISEVVNSMKDLIDYSRETATGPMESLAKFPRRTNPSPGSGFRSHPQQPEGPARQQQTTGPIPISKANNPSVPMTSSSSGTAAVGLLHHQNSMNSRHQQNSISGSSSPYACNNNNNNNNSIHDLPQAQSSPFQSPTTSNNVQQLNTHGNNNSGSLQGGGAHDDGNDSQSSVQKIIKNMMVSSHVGGGNDNGINSGAHVILGNNGHSGFMGNGIRGTNSMPVNGGRAAMMMVMPSQQHQQQQQQQDLGNQMLGGLGGVNGFNDLQFDNWKPSP